MKTRKIDRNTIAANGTLRTVDGRSGDVALTDLSEGGCRINQGSLGIIKGSPVELQLIGGSTHRANVRWSKDGQAGIGFVKELSPTQLEQITKPETEAAPLHKVDEQLPAEPATAPNAPAAPVRRFC